MIYQVCLFLVLFLAGSRALQFSNSRPFYKEGELVGNDSAEAYSLLLTEFSNSTEVYTSGLLRTDIYDSSRRWVRAQVWRIGVCFMEGDRGGTAVILQTMMTSSHILRVTNIYVGSDCDGGYETILLKVPIARTAGSFEYIINHEPDFETALRFPSHVSDGIIIASYYSAEGCAGPVAQYDLVSADEYVSYDDAIGACGMFQCQTEAKMMVLTLFGTYDGNPFIHPYCRRDKSISEDNDDELYSGNDELSGYRSIKQPFQCTDVSVVGLKGGDFPLFQTVHCVEATYDLDSTDEEVGYADEVEERDPEFDLFYGSDNTSNEDITPQEDEWYFN